MRKLTAAVLLVCGLLVAGRFASAGPRTSIQQFFDAIHGYVILGNDTSGVHVALCNRTQEEVGVTLSYTSAQGAKTSNVLVSPSQGSGCTDARFDPGTFRSLPAGITLDAISDESSSSAHGTLSVKRGLNAATFGAGKYCANTYQGVRDDVNPTVESSYYRCFTLSRRHS